MNRTLAVAGSLVFSAALLGPVSAGAATPNGAVPAESPAASVSYVEGTDAASPLFDPTRVVSIDLAAPQSSIDALWVDPKGAYQDATMTVTTPEATFGPWNVGMRLKGGWGSLRDLNGKAAFKIKVNHAQKSLRLLGLKKLTLNNMVQDPSMLHEALGYRLFRAMGIAAPRVGYARVSLNGAAYGLYANVETPDDVMLQRWFESTSHLYEGAYWTDLSSGNEGSFEVDEGDDADRSDLTALMSAANASDEAWWRQIQRVADVGQFTRMWAVEAFIGHWDGYSRTIKNNYYLHSDDAGKFTMLPWGIDQTFSDNLGWLDTTDASILFTRCMALPQCFRLYNTALALTVQKARELDLVGMASTIEAAVLSDMISDPRREYDEGTMEWFRYRTRSFIPERIKEAKEHLAALLPLAPTLSVRSIRGMRTVVFDAPTPGLLPITGAQVQMARAGQAITRAPIATVSRGRFEIPSGVQVRLRVRLVNDFGTSKWSTVMSLPARAPSPAA